MIVLTVLLWASIAGNLLFLNTVNQCFAFKETYFKRTCRSWRINNVNFEGDADIKKVTDKSGKGFGKVKVVPKPLVSTNEKIDISETSPIVSTEPSEIIDPSLKTEDLIMKTDLYKR